mgnify:CR=1 FL=1
MEAERRGKGRLERIGKRAGRGLCYKKVLTTKSEP